MNYTPSFAFLSPTQQAASLFSEALGLHQQGQLDAAHALYQKVLKIRPKHPDTLQLMGTLALQRGQYADAIDWIQRSLKLNGRNASAWNNLGLSYKKLGRFEEALGAFDRALAVQKDLSDALFNRASVLAELGRFEDAKNMYDRLLAVAPSDAELHFRKARVLAASNEAASALASYRQAIALDPNHVEALTARAVLLSETKQTALALQDFEKVVQLAPAQPSAHSNLGNALSDVGRVGEALVCYAKALALDPQFVDAHFNTGVVRQAQRQIEAAIAAYKTAVAIDPEHVFAQWNLGLCQLMSGDLLNGWKQYEWRWKNPQLDVYQERRMFSVPRWDGTQDLAGKTLLLYSEQGLGDTIQFCRYADLAAQRGAKVILEVQQPLIRLLSNLKGVHTLIERGAPVPAIDFECPLMSVPLAFQTTIDSVPALPAYLQADSQLRGKWATRLGNTADLRVGVVWTGRASHANDHHRSATLNDILPLQSEGIQWVCLQNELREDDARHIQHHPAIRYFGEALTDMAETAALCDLMDVVVSVDTSVAHLAAALGKPVFLMLPFVPDWRWLLDRDDSPWYPSVQVFRQKQEGHWHPVMESIQHALAQVRTAKRELTAAASPETP